MFEENTTLHAISKFEEFFFSQFLYLVMESPLQSSFWRFTRFFDQFKAFLMYVDVTNNCVKFKKVMVTSLSMESFIAYHFG